MSFKTKLKQYFPFLLRIRLFYYEFLLRLFPVYMTKRHYYKVLGKKLDLKNPRDLNEKIQWLKLYSDTSKWPDLADKYKVREYVKQCGLENLLNDLYGVWDTPEKIDFSKLPKQFVLKTNNGCGDVVIIKDKYSIDEFSIKNQLKKDLNRLFGIMSVEPHYLKIKPCIIAEKMLVNDIEYQIYSDSIIDYKCWCFNGKVYYVLVCCNRDKFNLDLSLYDCNWETHPEYLVVTSHYRHGKIIPKPNNFSDMIRAAEILSRPFPCVRVDFYIVGGKIYFGEMTFTSAQGCMSYFTNEFLLKMGEMVNIKSRS